MNKLQISEDTGSSVIGCFVIGWFRETCFVIGWFRETCSVIGWPRGPHTLSPKHQLLASWFRSECPSGNVFYVLDVSNSNNLHLHLMMKHFLWERETAGQATHSHTIPFYIRFTCLQWNSECLHYHGKDNVVRRTSSHKGQSYLWHTNNTNKRNHMTAAWVYSHKLQKRCCHPQKKQAPVSIAARPKWLPGSWTPNTFIKSYRHALTSRIF